MTLVQRVRWRIVCNGGVPSTVLGDKWLAEKMARKYDAVGCGPHTVEPVYGEDEQ